MNAFVLELDTTAPKVTLDSPDAIEPGVVSIPYTINEPALLDATLSDGDQTVALDVLSDRLQGTTDFVPTRLLVSVCDGVGNAATYVYSVGSTRVHITIDSTTHANSSTMLPTHITVSDVPAAKVGTATQLKTVLTFTLTTAKIALETSRVTTLTTTDERHPQ